MRLFSNKDICVFCCRYIKDGEGRFIVGIDRNPIHVRCEKGYIEKLYKKKNKAGKI
jgi:hypothetical protein